jgi:four helix bundle protein
MMAKAYRDLVVWQRAIEMTVAVYKLSSRFPKDEMYGLTSQVRRASVSVASDIAEGYGRGTRGEYKQFLNIARGSNYEVQTQLVIARELGFGDTKDLGVADSLSAEVGKMIFTLIDRLGTSKALAD